MNLNFVATRDMHTRVFTNIHTHTHTHKHSGTKRPLKSLVEGRRKINVSYFVFNVYTEPRQLQIQMKREKT